MAHVRAGLALEARRRERRKNSLCVRKGPPVLAQTPPCSTKSDSLFFGPRRWSASDFGPRPHCLGAGAARRRRRVRSAFRRCENSWRKWCFVLHLFSIRKAPNDWSAPRPFARRPRAGPGSASPTVGRRARAIGTSRGRSGFHAKPRPDSPGAQKTVVFGLWL